MGKQKTRLIHNEEKLNGIIVHRGKKLTQNIIASGQYIEWSGLV